MMRHLSERRDDGGAKIEHPHFSKEEPRQPVAK